MAVFAVLAGMVLAVLVVGLPATAAEGADTEPATSFSCRVTDSVDGQQVDRSLLPVSRWGDAASGGLHTRLDPGTLGLDTLENRTVRGTIIGGSLSIGNSLWQGTASLLEFATTMRALDSAGCAADRAGAAIGRAVLDSGLLAAAVVVLLLGVAWRSWRHGAATGTWSTLLRAALVVALFAIMLSGAMRTSGPRDLGVGSPGWLLTNLEDVIGSVASAPAQALDGAVADSSLVDDPGSNDAMHCDRYAAELRTRYREAVGGTGLATSQASVPLVVSAMWERSGLAIHSSAQFGPANPFGDAVGCRLLERRAQVPADEQRLLTAASGAGTQVTDRAADVVFVGADALTTDRVIVAWASCRFSDGAWRADPRWQQVQDRDPVTDDACATLFWSEGDVDATQYDDPVNGQQASPFEFAETPEELPEHVQDPEVQTFLANFHGYAVTGGVTVSGIYVLVSLVVATVFGLLGLAIVVTKVALVAVAAMAFVALLVALLPTTGGARLARYARMVVGLVMLALGSQLLLALVLVLTELVASAGFAVFDGASVEGVIWLGFAPVAAVVTLHLAFTRGLGAPSPLVPSTALAYGRAFASGAVTRRGMDRLRAFAQSQGRAGADDQAGRVDTSAGTRDHDDVLDRETLATRARLGRGDNRQAMAAREQPREPGVPPGAVNGSPPAPRPPGVDRSAVITPGGRRRRDVRRPDDGVSEDGPDGGPEAGAEHHLGARTGTQRASSIGGPDRDDALSHRLDPAGSGTERWPDPGDRPAVDDQGSDGDTGRDDDREGGRDRPRSSGDDRP